MKKNKIFLPLLLMLGFMNGFSQQIYSAKNGMAVATSETILATITTKNANVTGALDLKSGSFECQLQMKEFEFESRLMKEHFNDWFVHSDKFPSVFFSGTMDPTRLDFEKTTRIEVSGFMEFHGEMKKMNTTVQLEKKERGMSATGHFILKLDDFNIEIPKILSAKLANEISVKVDLSFEPNPQVISKPSSH